jgi:hypothetical protein
MTFTFLGFSYTFSYVDAIGLAAAASAFVASSSKTMIPLRVATTLSNALFVVYGLSLGLWIGAAMNAVLCLVNFVRLLGMMKLVRQVKEVAQGEFSIEWLKPYMTPTDVAQGAVLFKKGDVAHTAYYVVSGTLRLVEIDVTIGADTLIGEMGLFTADNRRTMTVEAVTKVRLLTIDYAAIQELYLQNPQFGFYLLKTIVRRLHRNRELQRAAQAAASRDGPPS